VVFAYREHDANGVVYQAVHKGTVVVTVTANGLSRPFRIIVQDPGRLGPQTSQANVQLNPLLYPMAHMFGIPPQYLKGHIHKEVGGSFDPLGYRYEPLGPYADLLSFSGKGSPQLRKAAPYSNYRFATLADSSDGPLAEGQYVNDSDRGVAVGRLRIGCTPTSSGRLVTADDTFVSAREIVLCNDGIQNWVKIARANGPSRLARLKSADFTAQLSLASSYGYFQMMYSTAIGHWVGTGPETARRKHPSALFDTPENRNAGGGTLLVGPTKIAADFRAATNSTPLQFAADSPEVFFNTSDFQGAFRLAWTRYNLNPSYPSGVWSGVVQYPIEPSRSLF
jgi:hypothetical protein